jgi:hypothetical protein
LPSGTWRRFFYKIRYGETKDVDNSLTDGNLVV